jgi:catechol 2,3-dioxygenase-like lactoylglutathione lyase family enzyme
MPLHHVEIWVPDLERAERAWGWLLTRLGWTVYQRWEDGRSWRDGETYVVLEQSSALRGATHDRLRPGLNHIAVQARDAATVDAVVAAAPEHGWRLLFADQHPHAGGPDTYAAYLEDADGFEVEVVAATP